MTDYESPIRNQIGIAFKYSDHGHCCSSSIDQIGLLKSNRAALAPVVNSFGLKLSEVTSVSNGTRALFDLFFDKETSPASQGVATSRRPDCLDQPSASETLREKFAEIFAAPLQKYTRQTPATSDPAVVCSAPCPEPASMTIEQPGIIASELDASQRAIARGPAHIWVENERFAWSEAVPEALPTHRGPSSSLAPVSSLSQEVHLIKSDGNRYQFRNSNSAPTLDAAGEARSTLFKACAVRKVLYADVDAIYDARQISLFGSPPEGV